MRLLLFLVIANFFILTVSCVQVYDESAEEPPCLCSDSFCLCRSQENYDDDLPHSKKISPSSEPNTLFQCSDSVRVKELLVPRPIS